MVYLLWGEECSETDIQEAALNGDLILLESLIQTEDEVDVTDEYGSTPLHNAAFQGHLHCIIFLVENGAYLNSQDNNGFTPLAIATFQGHIECVEYLVRNGADVNLEDKNGSYPLHKAALYNRLDCLKCLLQNNADVNAETSYRKTPLHLAAEHGHVECIKALVLHKAPLDATDKDGSTPLHKAAIQGHDKCIRVLVDAGADRTICNKDGATPLHNAADIGDAACTTELTKHFEGHESLNIGDVTGVTPLHQACYFGHESCVEILLKAKADVTRQTEKGTTPLHFASHMGHTSCVKLIVNASKKKKLQVVLQAQDVSGIIALHNCCWKGHDECAKILLESGADVNCADNEGATPLHKAAYADHASIVSLLLDYKAHADMQDTMGDTPLHKAAFKNNDETLDVMLKAGADPALTDNNGYTPLHNAAFTGSVSCLIKILENIPKQKVDEKQEEDDEEEDQKKLSDEEKQAALEQLRATSVLNVKDRNGSTPLHVAVERHMADVVRYLISHMDLGLDVNAKDNKGKTPLFYAVMRGDVELSKDLIYEEADIELADNEGTTIASLASTNSDAVPEASLREFVKEGIEYRKRRHLEDPETKAKITKGISLFNNKPVKGIKLLIEENVLPNTPTDIAKFLLSNKKLDKRKIGELLGEENQVEVLNAFVDQMDFQGLEFETALRRFLTTFRLPGEAQKIDRMMEAFAQRYHMHNPDSCFHDGDAAYVLAFSVIMLNTDAHNPAIKKANKMSKQQFVGNNRCINNGEDLPREFLEEIYDRIIEDEIKMDADQTIYSNAEKKGYLTKQGGRIKTWKRRWFVLTNNCLYYFREKSDKDPCGIIPLENLEIKRVTAKGHKYCFIIQPPGGEGNIKACKLIDGNVVTGNHSRYTIACDTEKQLKAWMGSINSSMQRNPFYDLLQDKINKPN